LFFGGPVRVAGVQVLDTAEDWNEAVYEEAASTHHVGQDTRSVPPLQQ